MMWGEGGQPDRFSFAGLRKSGNKGGATPPTTTTNTATKLPDWLDTASQKAVADATALSNREYTPYTGEIVAPVNADTTQAYQQVRDNQGMANPAFDAAAQQWQALLGSASPITTGQLNQNTNQLFGNYQQNVMNPAAGLLGQFTSQGPATAAGIGQGAAQLMNPYSQQVIDPTLAAGEQQRQLARQQISGNAANVGAFGGSRQGVAEGVADAQAQLGTQQQIGQMLTQGWGQALNPATQAALQAGQQGLASNEFLSTLGQQGYQNAAQAGQGMANTNLQAGITAANQLPAQALAQAGQAQKDASMLQTIGAAQQNQQQTVDNAAMGQFYEKQGWPVQNLDILLSTLGGVPYGTTSTGTSEAAKPKKNLLGNIAGGAMSGASTGAVAGPYGAAAGAVVGGILGGLS